MATFTYDAGSDAGYVRLLTTDTAVTDPELRIFSDEEITAFLNHEGSPLMAAAAAIETIAASEVLIQKRMTLLGRDLMTDGPGEATELRAIAAAMRARPDLSSEDDAGFEIAEMVLTNAGLDERLWDEMLRHA